METKPTFSVIATPIGNLDDITLRALSTLSAADVVFCEDTRVTRKLLNHHNIKVPTKAFHAHSGQKGIDGVIKLLEAGQNCALVTDAGTPGISDPGPRLVQAIRNHFKDKVDVVPVPGPDAVTTLLSVAGINIQPYVFYGFLPTKKGRQTMLKKVTEQEKMTVVFYESTHRIRKLLQELPLHGLNRKIILGRELTKMHEDIMIGTTQEIEEIMDENHHRQKGEFVVIIPQSKQKLSE